MSPPALTPPRAKTVPVSEDVSSDADPPPEDAHEPWRVCAAVFDEADDPAALRALRALPPELVGATPHPDGISLLHRTALRGLESACASLLQADASANVTDAFGFRPLYYAAHGGHVAVAQLLLDGGAEPDARGAGGCTALLEAATIGSAPLVRTLCEGGADTEAVDDMGNSAVGVATQRSHWGVLWELARCGASWGAQQLVLGEGGWHRLEATTALEIGTAAATLKWGSVAEAEWGQVVDDQGVTLLHICALRGYTNGCRRLVALGASPLCADDAGKHPLHYAAMRGASRIVEELGDAAAAAQPPLGGQPTHPPTHPLHPHGDRSPPRTQSPPAPTRLLGAAAASPL